METGFKDPIKPKIKEKDVKDPWNFKQPQYDQRTSCYINAGTDYGVGFNQPVGHSGEPKSEGVPKGRIKTMDLYVRDEKAEIR